MDLFNQTGSLNSAIMNEQQIKNFSNHDLVKSLEDLFDNERHTTHFVLLHLKEIESRKLYADYGFSDLFEMLISYFKQSETAANQRRHALRLMNDVPEIKERLVAGELNLSTLAMAQRQIQREEKATGTKIEATKKSEIIERIACKTMTQAEKELMTLLPESSKSLETHERRISKDATRLSLTIPDRVKKKMEKLKNYWAAVNPRMDYLELIERSLDIALAKVDPTTRKKRDQNSLKMELASVPKTGATKTKSTSPKMESPSHSATESVAQDSTTSNAELTLFAEVQGANTNSTKPKISTNNSRTSLNQTEAPIKSSKRKTYYSRKTDRILWTRANSQCEFIDQTSGRRCSSQFGLERDHIIPLGKGGSNDIKNLRLLCRTHNQLMARRHFGAEKIRREIGKE